MVIRRPEMIVKPLMYNITSKEQVIEIAHGNAIVNYLAPPSGSEVLCVVVVEAIVHQGDVKVPMHEVTVVVVEDGLSLDNSEGDHLYQQTILRRVGPALHVYLKQNVEEVLKQIPDQTMSPEAEEAWKNIQNKLGG
jgi:hypothetical protein